VIRDLQLDLETLRDQPARTTASAPEATSRWWRYALLAGGAFAATAVAVTLVNWSPRGNGVTPSRADRALTRVTFGPGLQTDATFSPDGRTIAYASDRGGNFDIWIQPVSGGQPRQLTSSPAQERQPSWSPDGRRLVFRAEGIPGGLFVIPADGGVPRQVSAFGAYPAWSSDGAEVMFRSERFAGRGRRSVTESEESRGAATGRSSSKSFAGSTARLPENGCWSCSRLVAPSASSAAGAARRCWCRPIDRGRSRDPRLVPGSTVHRTCQARSATDRRPGIRPYSPPGSAPGRLARHVLALELVS